MKLKICLFILCLSSQISWAQEEPNYKYCLYAGYFGVNSFLGGISQKLIEKYGLFSSESSRTICSASMKRGYDASTRIISGDTSSEEDVRIMLQSSEFSDKVYQFVIEGANL